MSDAVRKTGNPWGPYLAMHVADEAVMAAARSEGFETPLAEDVHSPDA